MRASQSRLPLSELVDRFRALLGEQPGLRTEAEISEDFARTEAEILDFVPTSATEAAAKLTVIADGLVGGARTDGRDVGALREIACWLTAAINVQRQTLEGLGEGRRMAGSA